MTSTETQLVYVLMAVMSLSFVVITCFEWFRVNALARLVNDAIEKATPKRLTEVEATCQALAARVDQSDIEMGAYRSSVHLEMQRFDQIMRRKESAAKKLAAAEPTDDNEDDERFPDEVKGGPTRSDPEPGVRLSRAQLREMWKEKHGAL